MDDDDTGQLTDAERLRLFAGALDGARRGAVGRFASSLSHALGTPLNVIAGRAAMIGMAEPGDSTDARENARIIENQVKNITELLQRTLKFARDGAPQPAEVDLRELLGRVANLLAPLAAARNTTIEVAPGEPMPASVPAARVFDVVVGLASWAVNRAPASSSVRLSIRAGQPDPPPVERGRARSGKAAVIQLACPGGSIAPSLLEHVYEPWLVSGIEDRETALTLAVAFGIAREHRGWIEAAVSPEAVTFSVVWPI